MSKFGANSFAKTLMFREELVWCPNWGTTGDRLDACPDLVTLSYHNLEIFNSIHHQLVDFFQARQTLRQYRV
jgi:hypothetical protein